MYISKEEGLIQRRGNMLIILQQMYLANPQLIIDTRICRDVARKCKTTVYNTDSAAKYAMQNRPITREDIRNFNKEEEEYRKTYHKPRASKEKTMNQLFANGDIVSHKESQPTTTTDANIIDVRNLAVQFLRNNNLKILKIELRDGSTPLITFE